jgi:chromosome segregation ATPase
MNNDLEGFGQWRRTVDSRLGTPETRVAEQASLRAKMDEDMSDLKVEFRAQRTLLQALHDTQQEHSATLREHGTMLTEHGTMLREHGTQLTELQTGQQRIMVGVDAIREMLDRTLNSGNE